MTKHLYTQDIESAFEDFSAAGANRERYQFWLDSLAPAIPQIKSKPQREAEPVFSLPSRTDDLAEIEEIASTISKNFTTLVVAGMGGSSLSGETLAYLRKPGGLGLRFIDNIDPLSMDTLTQSLDWEKTAFLVISKSGNTAESLAQMAILLRGAKSKTSNYAKQFFVITITDGNPLHTIAKTHGMRVLAHDPKLGGRFSILSCVGLIPAAAIGLNIRALRAGALATLNENFSAQAKNAPAAQSAALHLALMEKNVRMNVMMYYGDPLGGLANWYRQCWGESLGKCSKATTPVRARGTTDQHSQLQLYLDGPKDKLFSMMLVDSLGKGEAIDFENKSDNRLNFLSGRKLGDLMAAHQRGTVETLIKRGCPVRKFTMKQVNEETLGALLMHFSLEIIFTAQLLNVNAFDQPAVEDSKILALRYLAGDDSNPAAQKRA
jgi:glucose-6-phosphate isomerase